MTEQRWLESVAAYINTGRNWQADPLTTAYSTLPILNELFQLPAIELSSASLLRLRRVRDEVRTVWLASSQVLAIERINLILGRTQSCAQLVTTPAGDVELTVTSSRADIDHIVAARCAFTLATVVADGRASDLHPCSLEGCNGVFADTTKNHTRQYCSPRCANRVHMHSHRSRIKGRSI